MYSGGPHISFPFLRFGVPSRPNPPSGSLKSTLPGPREGSSIINVDLVVVSAAVCHVQAVAEASVNHAVHAAAECNQQARCRERWADQTHPDIPVSARVIKRALPLVTFHMVSRVAGQRMIAFFSRLANSS